MPGSAAGVRAAGLVNVLGAAGAVLVAEYDHFYSRERRGFAETWLVCRPCNGDLTVNGREAHAAAFEAYQARAGRFEASAQQELPLAP